MTKTEAVIFDMDGLLTESESKWRQAEQEVSDSLGLGFTAADFEQTMGVRMAEVAELWYGRKPWDGPSPAEVANLTIDRVVELMEGAKPLPGVVKAVELVSGSGLSVGLCSSSDTRLIEVVLKAIGLSGAFEVVHSAENDRYGKPHPEPYLRTAELLEVKPRCCLALEDSLSGCISAKAASMKVVAVPDPEANNLHKFAFCDLVLGSMEGLGSEKLADLLGQ